jgi:hypothetical protein
MAVARASNPIRIMTAMPGGVRIAVQFLAVVE